MIKNLRGKTSDELKLMMVQLRSQLLQNNFAAANGQFDKTHLKKEIRKVIAQVLTVLHERKDRMETKDWHRFQKQVNEEQAKANEESKEKAKKSDGLVSNLKEKATKLFKADKAEKKTKEADKEENK